jgi:type IV secretion system protein VirB5
MKTQTKTRTTIRWITVIGAFCVPLTLPAHAALPVIDVRAIMQMVQQIATLREQLATARDQLREAQQQLRAMTGGRGQENLLPAEPRNYLPANWGEMAQVLGATSLDYRGLVTALETLRDRNAVLPAATVARLPVGQRALLDAQRREVALGQSVARDALAVTSERFHALGGLIAALSRADDPKAVWDLQARIGIEQAMLTNEQAKLATVFETLRAERELRRQQAREAALRDVGRYGTLRPLGL